MKSEENKKKKSRQRLFSFWWRRGDSLSPAGETRHYEFLKQNRPSTVGVMRMNGSLEGYLREVNREATETLETLVRHYATAEGVTEALKRTDQLEWMRRMNNIRNRAEEIVLPNDFCNSEVPIISFLNAVALYCKKRVKQFLE